jgi:hypothetical protein
MTEVTSLNSDPEANGGTDLDTLRDLLFGNQVRDLSRRLTELDARLETAKRDLKGTLNTRSEALATSNIEQVAALRKELTSRIEKETRTLAERIDTVATEFSAQLQTAQRELSEQLETLQHEFSDRLHIAQEEARQRDEELRNELLALSAWLDDKKTSRHDLGQMLEEVGQRLQLAAANPSANNKGKSKKS